MTYRNNIGLDVVLHIAELSRLRFKKDELNKLKDELNKIINYMDKIHELSREEFKEKKSSPLKLRKDSPRATLKKKEGLRGAPQVFNNYFVVPRVIIKK